MSSDEATHHTEDELKAEEEDVSDVEEKNGKEDEMSDGKEDKGTEHVDSDISESEEEKEKPPARGRATKKDRIRKKDDSDEDYEMQPKTKKAKRKGGVPRKESGYTKACKLSAELSDVMGTDSMPRHEVVKKMWEIIKGRNLQDPKNKQFAICDEELLKVFGVKRFRTFGMMKYLKKHLF